jgi:hypothetical protein
MTGFSPDCWRDRSSARRAAALALHPDVGGDSEEFVAALAAIDRRFGYGREVTSTEAGEIVLRRTRRGAFHARRRMMRHVFRRAGVRLAVRRRRYHLQ